MKGIHLPIVDFTLIEESKEKKKGVL